MKKIFPSKLSLFKQYIIIAPILLIFIYLIFSSRMAWLYIESDDKTGYIIQDVIVLLAGIALDVVLWFILISKNYYEVINNGIVHHRMFNEVVYDFDHVLYINEDYTLKHKVLLFYNEHGKELFLVLDKDLELYNIFKEKCKKLISQEEFKTRFPRVKL